MSLPHYVYRVRRLVINHKAQQWCGLPYPGHPHGCPNFKSGKPQCPFVAPLIEDIMDTHRACWLVHGEFDLYAHTVKMREKHPHWTEKQLRNVLYWQPRSKASMKARAKAFAATVGADFIHYMAEAAGVNLYATAFLSGLKLERIKGLRICRHTALVGWRK